MREHCFGFNIISYDNMKESFSSVKPIVYTPLFKGLPSITVSQDRIVLFGESGAESLRCVSTNLTNLTRGWVADKIVSYEDFLNNSEFEDAKLYVEEKEIGINSTILSNLSRNFNDWVNGEGSSGKFKIEEVKADAMVAVLRFIYSNWTIDFGGTEVQKLKEIIDFLTSYSVDYVLCRFIEVK